MNKDDLLPLVPPRNISIIIPAMNEEDSLPELFRSIENSLKEPTLVLKELIIIDDGSTDGTWNEIKNLSISRPDIPLVAFRFRRNFGKAAALDHGFRIATGDYVITMDADLQDDPAEIVRLVNKLEEGWDLVTGWKETRHDPISKTLPSKLFNFVTSKVTGLKLHDFNCGLKAYRKEVLSTTRIYGELHRFIPAIAFSMGFRVTEISVTHHPRRFGESKYGWRRFLRGSLDLLTVVATTRYLSRPAHLFGGLGVLIGSIGFVTLTYLSIIWFAGLGPIGNRPLLLFGILCVLMATQLIFFGILAELFVRPVRNEKTENLYNISINKVAKNSIRSDSDTL